HAVRLELLAVDVVELVAVAVPLVDHVGAVGPLAQAVGQQVRRVEPQPHGAAHLRDRVLVVEQADDRVLAVALDLGGVGLRQADRVAGDLDDGALKPQADAEEGDLPFAGEADGLDLAADAAVAEAARHQHPVHAAQDALGALALDVLRLDAPDHYAGGQGDTG